MKILHVNMADSGGGLEQYLSLLLRELDDRGYKNFFLCGQTSKGRPLSNLMGDYHIDKVTHLDCNDVSIKLKQVDNILKTVAPHIVFIHQVLNPQLIDLLTERVPSVRFVHGFKLVCPEGTKTLFCRQQVCNHKLNYSCQLKAYLYQCMPRNPLIGLPLIYKSLKNGGFHKKRSHMVVASEFMKSVLRYNGFPQDGISVIPYFVDMPETKSEYPSGGPPTVLFLGRLVKIKGVHHLLDAFRSVNQNVRLKIIGAGPASENLKQLADRYGLQSRVSFHGWITHDRLEDIFRQSHVVVVPSIWPEPFGIVGLEAMSYGKPVVASDVGGVSEWCRNGETGFLTSAGDPAMLAEKINYLIDNPSVAKRLGETGREQVNKNFTSKIHLQRLCRLFEITASRQP